MLKLTEVAQNVYELPGGLYRGSFALIMSQETFDALRYGAVDFLQIWVFPKERNRDKLIMVLIRVT